MEIKPTKMVIKTSLAGVSWQLFFISGSLFDYHYGARSHEARKRGFGRRGRCAFFTEPATTAEPAYYGTHPSWLLAVGKTQKSTCQLTDA
jgi:hypothetical protein